MKIKKKLLQFVSPDIPKEERLAAARGYKDMDAEDLVTVLFILSHEREKEVSAAAGETFSALSPSILISALSGDVDQAVIKAVEALLGRACHNPNTADETLIDIVENGPLSVVEIVSNSPRLAGNLKLFEAIVRNQRVPRPTLQQAEKMFSSVPVGTAAEVESLPDELLREDAEEFIEVEEESLLKVIVKMTVPQKIKLAITGNKEARSILLKETNKVITRCVISNPRISEDEVVAIASAKTTSDETLRQIARNDEWLKNYQIRKGLTCNPKTPFFVSSRLVPRLNESDVRMIAKSKDVPHMVAGLARRLVDDKSRR